MFLSAGDSYAAFTLGALGMSFTSMFRAGVGATESAVAPSWRERGWRTTRSVADAPAAMMRPAARFLPASEIGS
jgi:hypothetical protein